MCNEDESPQDVYNESRQENTVNPKVSSEVKLEKTNDKEWIGIELLPGGLYDSVIITWAVAPMAAANKSGGWACFLGGIGLAWDFPNLLNFRTNLHFFPITLW